ncbi:WGR domain-containing protein [Desulfogranum marinum]|uniref:WGR domain-containing protein n=1 Tax=Desulfogranum marinum TaxID=453220 RepID=UPI0029C64524|nr:WGR domain-containing protein [Desulfogranum marinum]
MLCYKYSYYVCIIPDRNKEAFYELFAGKDLWGFILIRRWGRIGTKGQPGKKQRFLEKTGMLKEYERVHHERIKHGYLQVNQTFHEIMKQESDTPDSHT